jgi:EpsI family protein
MPTDWPRILVPVLLIAQGISVHFAAGRESLPATPVLSRFPAEFSEWSRLRDDPLEPELVNELHADQLLNRIYVNRPTGSLASLLLAWFQSQRGGQSQPHSPKVCLPASGWVPEVTGEVDIETLAGPIRVNRYLVVNRNERAVVLYWYQTPQRAIASEWASKFWVLADALRRNRTDTALVRVVVWSAAGGDGAATETARNFAQGLYPLLRDQLPR